MFDARKIQVEKCSAGKCPGGKMSVRRYVHSSLLHLDFLDTLSNIFAVIGDPECTTSQTRLYITVRNIILNFEY